MEAPTTAAMLPGFPLKLVRFYVFADRGFGLRVYKTSSPLPLPSEQRYHAATGASPVISGLETMDGAALFPTGN